MQNLISELRTILLELSSFWDMLKKKTQLYLEIFKTFSQDSLKKNRYLGKEENFWKHIKATLK